MAEKLIVKENVFFNIDDLNTFIEDNKIKKFNIISIENIVKEGLYDYGSDNQQTRIYMSRLLWIKEKELLNE